MFVAAPSSLLSLVQLAPIPSYMHEFIRTKTCGDEPSPSVEQNLIGSLVGKPARLTTGYTISLSKHALQLIYIALSYNLSTDPRPTPIAHRGRGRRPACSPAAHMLYSDKGTGHKYETEMFRILLSQVMGPKTSACR
jgi:hypothetical protein